MSTRTAKAFGAGAATRVPDPRGNESMLHAASPERKTFFSEERERLLQIIRKKSLLRGEFKLASGQTSNYYLDMKPTTFDPEGSNLVSDIVLGMLIDDADIDAVGGLEMGAVPIVVSVSTKSWPTRPVAGFVVRKEKKGHGTDNLIDGNFPAKGRVILIEDVTTTGDSVMQAVRAVRKQGGTVKKIITIVDRLGGAADKFKKEGIEFAAIFTAPELLASK